MSIIKKVVASAASSAGALAWRRLSWQARAAWVGASMALRLAKRAAGIRRALTGSGGRNAHNGAHNARHVGSAASVGVPAAAAALAAQ